MSSITSNQITLFDIYDGEPGPVGPQGPQGDKGEQGEPGDTLYTWVAYASLGEHDGVWEDVSADYIPGVHTHIGHRYGMTTMQDSSSISPGGYTWTPFYSHLIAEKLRITEDGSIYSGYNADGSRPPGMNKGFYLGGGHVKAHNGEFTGTFRSGEGAEGKARLAAAETVGVGNISFSGGLDDLSLPSEGTTKADFDIRISQLNIQHSYQLEHTYLIGDVGPGGGFIFYDKGSWSDGWRYLEIAPVAVEYEGPHISVSSTEWANAGLSTYINWENMGDGEFCTNALYPHDDRPGPSVLKYCHDLVYGGRSDWYFPTYYEMKKAVQALTPLGLGTFKQYTSATNFPRYWTNSYQTSNDMYQLEINGTSTSSNLRSGSYFEYVRPIRKVLESEKPMDTFYYYRDAFQWRVNGGAWSTQQDIVSGQQYSLGYGGLVIAFGNETGHTLYQTWSFSQDELFGLSIKDSGGLEYLKAINGALVTAKNEHRFETPHGYIELGPKNSSYAHIYSDKAFYFNQNVHGTKVYGAVGNDIVDYIQAPEGWGYGYAHIVNGSYYGIPSDTGSITAGTKRKGSMPRAVVGFVLVYVDRSYPVNTKLTYRADGTLTKKTWWMRRPVIATYYMKPPEKEWNEVQVNSRHIVKVVC